MPADMSALLPIDHELLSVFASYNEDMRAALCFLARRGTRWRRAEPERCRAWLAKLETHPFYKGGQVLFDLLEWEDFMLDGDPPRATMAAILPFLQKLSAAVDVPLPEFTIAKDLPPLEAGFYLYRDVVLGGISLTIDAASQADFV